MIEVPQVHSDVIVTTGIPLRWLGLYRSQSRDQQSRDGPFNDISARVLTRA